MMATSGLSFWTMGVYVHPLEEEFGWTRSQTSGATSISFLVSGLLGPYSGSVIDRSGVRRPLLLGALGLFFVLMLLSGTQSLWQFYALYALMAVARVWVNYIPFLRLVARWFPQRMGAPVGVMGLGWSAAGLVFVPMATWLVGSLGWRGSYFASAFVLLTFTIPIILLLKAPGTLARPATVARLATEFTLREALRMRGFWMLALALGLFFGGTMSFSFHAVPVFLSRGLSDVEAAWWVGAIALATTVFRLGAGPLADRVGRLHLFAPVAGLAPALGLIALALGEGGGTMVLFVLLWGLGTAVGPIMESVLTTRLFGTASFGAILGALGVAETVGTVLGPIAGGAIYDASGSYNGALVLYACGFLVAAGAFVLGRHGQD